MRWKSAPIGAICSRSKWRTTPVSQQHSPDRHQTGSENTMDKKSSRKWIVTAIVLVVGGFLGYKYWLSGQSALPDGIVSGNGRIEARLSDASAKEPLRVKEILVDEGDLVRPGQVLARLDTSTLEAELARDQGAVAAAREQLASAKAAIAGANADIAAVNSDIVAANSDVTAAKSDAVAATAGIAAAQAS